MQRSRRTSRFLPYLRRWCFSSGFCSFARLAVAGRDFCGGGFRHLNLLEGYRNLTGVADLHRLLDVHACNHHVGIHAVSGRDFENLLGEIQVLQPTNNALRLSGAGACTLPPCHRRIGHIERHIQGVGLQHDGVAYTEALFGRVLRHIRFIAFFGVDQGIKLDVIDADGLFCSCHVLSPTLQMPAHGPSRR